MTDYEKLSKIDFLPELAKLDLHGKAKVIQSLLEENFFHPSGLFYSILLIDGPHHVRPMGREDMVVGMNATKDTQRLPCDSRYPCVTTLRSQNEMEKNE